MPFALSTAWNASRYDSAQPMFLEIKKLGFLDLELSFNLTNPMVLEANKLARAMGLNIGSVHNFCPIPEGFERKKALPDCYSLSSLDKEDRGLALKFTKRSINAASLLGAKVVVLHCGRVETKDQTKNLIDLYYRGLKNTETFTDLKEGILRDRASVSQPFFDSTLESLDELNKYAEEKNIYLGIENRFYYCEIPNLEEIGIIFDEFRSSNIFYWHDVGHAQVSENLGFHAHKDYLDRYSRKMIGIHLHNIIGCEDHQAPVTGQFDFNKLKPYLKKETLKVIEVDESATADVIKKSQKLLEKIFNERA